MYSSSSSFPRGMREREVKGDNLPDAVRKEKFSCLMPSHAAACVSPKPPAFPLSLSPHAAGIQQSEACLLTASL